MRSVPPVEACIELVSSLKTSIVALCDAYRARPHLIDREERAVRAHDFPTLLALREDYDALNDKVESEVTRLRSLCGKLAELHLSLFPDAETVSQHTATVSDALALLRQIRARLDGQALATKVLDHLLLGLDTEWKAFLVEKERIGKLIEKNHIILATLLDNYQKSYQFWQEQCERSVTSYNGKGQQSTQGRLSGFAVRA